MIIQVGQAIGALWTVLILIVDSLIGARLLSLAGPAGVGAFQDALAEGRIPHREVLDGVLIILGGAFLLTPGLHHGHRRAAAADTADARGICGAAHPHDAAPRRRSGGPRVVVARRARRPVPAEPPQPDRAPPPTAGAAARPNPAAMIGPRRRAAQNGPGEFRTSWTSSCSDDRGVVAARIARAARRRRRAAVGWSAGRRAGGRHRRGRRVGGRDAVRASPAARHGVDRRSSAGRCRSTRRARRARARAHPPTDEPTRPRARAAGLSRYDQMCERRRARWRSAGQRRQLDGIGACARTAGAPVGRRRRVPDRGRRRARCDGRRGASPRAPRLTARSWWAAIVVAPASPTAPRRSRTCGCRPCSATPGCR